ncbi:MAG: nucleotidyltransferase family protein [Nitrosomonadaceae bacterium]
MTKIIENNRAQLVSLCKKYKVAELDVFGSAATDDFDPVQSDIDFLVEFQETVIRDRFDNFFNLLNELKELFGRPIDLVEPGGLRNPYFIEMVNQTKRSLYVASQP